MEAIKSNVQAKRLSFEGNLHRSVAEVEVAPNSLDPASEIVSKSDLGNLMRAEMHRKHAILQSGPQGHRVSSKGFTHAKVPILKRNLALILNFAHHIAGAARAGRDAPELEHRNPSDTREVVFRAPIGTAADLDAAVEAATTAFATWRRTTGASRESRVARAIRYSSSTRSPITRIRLPRNRSRSSAAPAAGGSTLSLIAAA